MSVRNDVVDVVFFGPVWFWPPSTWNFCNKQHSRYFPSLQPLEETRRPKLANQRAPGHRLQGTRSRSFPLPLSLPIPQGPTVQAGCYGKNSEHGARRPRHKPWHHLYCLTLDRSINLPCFSLPIREFETNIYLEARGFGEILTTDALSTDPDMYQVLRLVFAESTLTILLHWGQ